MSVVKPMLEQLKMEIAERVSQEIVNLGTDRIQSQMKAQTEEIEQVRGILESYESKIENAVKRTK